MGRGLLSCFRRGRAPSSASKTSPAGGHEAAAEESPGAGAVLVELFSSQGCVTSPAAELLVSRLGRGDFEEAIGGGGGKRVVVLAFHVDYWDYMGWKDPYGSSVATVRQKAYVESLGLDTLFTPQVVVQGRAQCMGNDEDALLAAINAAPRFPAPKFQVTFQRPSPDSLQVTLTGALRTKVDGSGVDIMVALYESGLVTECPAGENKGRIMSNDFVVRKLKKLCSVKDISAKKPVSGTVNFSLWDGFNVGKSGVVVFIQNNSHHILGSQSFPLPGNI